LIYYRRSAKPQSSTGLADTVANFTEEAKPREDKSTIGEIQRGKRCIFENEMAGSRSSFEEE
jgi:hypothetical protein